MSTPPSAFPRIVITGVGVVSPLGFRQNVIVDNLQNGRSNIVPTVLDGILPLLMGRVNLEGIPKVFHDPILDFSLEATRQAWELSAIGDDFDPERVMTLIASSKGRLVNLLGGETRNLDYTDFPGEILGTTIARQFGFEGPVINLSAACATGIHSVIRAAQALQIGEADIALAGSAEASGKSLLMAGFKNMGALSDNPIRPFDLNRDGFNPGEGAAVFVMQREADAIARGAQILGYVSGWDQRSDAHHITSAEPSGAAVIYSIGRALKMAGWQPGDVEYINAHGTGTKLNDLVEGRSIMGAFGNQTPLVSSLKSYIGHLLGASAAVELGISLISLRAGYIPPTLTLQTPDPEIPLQFVSQGGILKKLHKYMKLSLGFGGHIGALAVELPQR